MKDLNSFNVSGRLVKDCDVKQLDNHKLITFAIASNYSQKKGNEWVDEVNYIDVKYWINPKSPVDEWLTKGVKVIITGDLRQERWQDKSDKAMSRMILLARDVAIIRSDSDGKIERGNHVSHNDDIPF